MTSKHTPMCCLCGGLKGLAVSSNHIPDDSLEGACHKALCVATWCFGVQQWVCVELIARHAPDSRQQSCHEVLCLGCAATPRGKTVVNCLGLAACLYHTPMVPHTPWVLLCPQHAHLANTGLGRVTDPGGPSTAWKASSISCVTFAATSAGTRS